jgi:hypothetical protein
MRSSVGVPANDMRDNDMLENDAPENEWPRSVAATFAPGKCRLPGATHGSLLQ